MIDKNFIYVRYKMTQEKQYILMRYRFSQLKYIQSKDSVCDIALRVHYSFELKKILGQ